MKRFLKQTISLGLCALAAVSLCACNAPIQEGAFDTPRPWHDDITIALGGSYEKLCYDVKIYDTTSGIDEDKRKQIAEGAMSFTIEEPPTDGYTTLTTDFKVTYETTASEPDAGLTDAITSRVLFSSYSMAVKEMQKTVELADRVGTDNLSYKIAADYFGAHEATLSFHKSSDTSAKTVKLPEDTCHDNEMMFMLARAQKLEVGTSNVFKAVNLFDTFNNNKLTDYTMYASAATELKPMYIGDWVKDFGIESSTEEITGTVSYPVPCYDMTVGINASRQGPPYRVMYSSVSFKSGEKQHYKLPVFISYSQYKNNKAFRTTEYTLVSCMFDKPTE